MFPQLSTKLGETSNVKVVTTPDMAKRRRQSRRLFLDSTSWITSTSPHGTGQIDEFV